MTTQLNSQRLYQSEGLKDLTCYPLDKQLIPILRKLGCRFWYNHDTEQWYLSRDYWDELSDRMKELLIRITDQGPPKLEHKENYPDKVACDNDSHTDQCPE